MYVEYIQNKFMKKKLILMLTYANIYISFSDSSWVAGNNSLAIAKNAVTSFMAITYPKIEIKVLYIGQLGIATNYNRK